MSQFLHSFIVLTTDDYATPSRDNVSKGAVGYVEGTALGGLAVVRFSGDRLLNLADSQVRQATAGEVAANDADADADDYCGVDPTELYNISRTLERLGKPFHPDVYITAAKLRAHGELSCDETDIRLMVERIRRDHTDRTAGVRRFMCKACGHYQDGEDCDDMVCEGKLEDGQACGACDWSPR